LTTLMSTCECWRPLSNSGLHDFLEAQVLQFQLLAQNGSSVPDESALQQALREYEQWMRSGGQCKSALKFPQRVLVRCRL
jgi:hypothetical protein